MNPASDECRLTGSRAPRPPVRCTRWLQKELVGAGFETHELVDNVFADLTDDFVRAECGVGSEAHGSVHGQLEASDHPQSPSNVPEATHRDSTFL